MGVEFNRSINQQRGVQKVGGYFASFNPPGDMGQFFDRPLYAHPLMPNSFCLLVIAHKGEGLSFGRRWFMTVQAGVIIAGRAVFEGGLKVWQDKT